MPELLLRDEQQTTAKWEEEPPPKPMAVFMDTNAILQYSRYVDYLFQHVGISSLVCKFGIEEQDFPEYIVGGQVQTPNKPLVVAWGRKWPYHGEAVWIVGATPELSDIEAYDVKYARPTKVIPAVVLSQTAEFLGYASPKQLELDIESPAFKLLENLTLASLTQKILDKMALEKRQGTPIRSVSITSFKDPEAMNFEQLVIKVYLDSDSETALRIWDDLSRDIEGLKKDLSPHEIDVLNERLGLDCEW